MEIVFEQCLAKAFISIYKVIIRFNLYEAPLLAWSADRYLPHKEHSILVGFIIEIIAQRKAQQNG